MNHDLRQNHSLYWLKDSRFDVEDLNVIGHFIDTVNHRLEESFVNSSYIYFAGPIVLTSKTEVNSYVISIKI